MENTDMSAERHGVAYVRLEGSPYQRGLIHGETLRTQIRELVARWKRGLQEQTGMTTDAFLERFLATTDYLTSIRRHAPDLLTEVEGVAAGSGLPFDTLYAYQLLDERILNARDVIGNCSCVAVLATPERPTLMGQNWDIESYIDGFQTLLHVVDDEAETESLVFTYAGLIAALGVNSHGVGICLNSLPILRYSRVGLPVAFVIRGALQSRTAAEAVVFIESRQHASPQNYLVCDPQSITDLECSSGKVERFTVPGNDRLLYHTNHPLVNNDFDQRYLDALVERATGQRTDFAYQAALEHLEADSSVRFKALQERLDAIPTGSVTVETIKSLLASHDSTEHPVCMSLGDDDKIASALSAVMELTHSPTIHVAAGPPDITTYETYSFAGAATASREQHEHLESGR
jgi:isopenicillin-N N-acyltransferase like protein